MYHRILKSKGGAWRVYEIEGGRPVRDAQFYVRPRAGERFDLYDDDGNMILEDERAASCGIEADKRGGGSLDTVTK